MKISRVIELLKVERECVRRNGIGCERDCANCDIAQDEHELVEMYDFLISMMEIKQCSKDCK